MMVAASPLLRQVAGVSNSKLAESAALFWRIWDLGHRKSKIPVRFWLRTGLGQLAEGATEIPSHQTNTFKASETMT
jgi:hypothetical protein